LCFILCSVRISEGQDVTAEIEGINYRLILDNFFIRHIYQYCTVCFFITTNPYNTA